VSTAVLLILGEERFLAREAIRAVLGAHPDADLSRYRGDKVAAGALLDELKTPSLLSRGRIVVVEEAGGLLESDAMAAIAAYAAAPAPGALLVLQTEKVDRRLKATKALLEAARVVDCAPVPAHQIAAWIVQRARTSHELQVRPDAARALLDRVGEDLGLLNAALARLHDQIAPRKTLTLDDVVESTEDHRSPILFEAANALESGDLAVALRAVEGCFAEGIRIRQDVVTEPAAIGPILLNNLHGAYRKLLRYHMIGDAVKVVGPRGARYFEGRARQHRLADLVARHHCFVDADLALKRTLGQPRQVLEQLLLGLLQKSRQSRH